LKLQKKTRTNWVQIKAQLGGGKIKTIEQIKAYESPAVKTFDAAPAPPPRKAPAKQLPSAKRGRDAAADEEADDFVAPKKERKVGTPERPLSDLGLVSYRGYWTRVLLTLLSSHRGTVSIKELSEATAIKTDDIIQTLTYLDMLVYQKGAYAIIADPESVARHLKAAGSAGVPVDPSIIIWHPFNGRTDP
jgi:hypothetical protein